MCYIPEYSACLPESKVILDGGSEKYGIQEIDPRDDPGLKVASHSPAEITLDSEIKGNCSGIATQWQACQISYEVQPCVLRNYNIAEKTTSPTA